MSQRTARVADLVRSELASIIQHELTDPRVRLATVASVDLSRDMSHATVRVSVLGDDDDERELAVEVLERAKGFVRSLLARRISTRAVPALVFELDRGAEHSQRISDILENLDDDAERP